MFRLQVFCSNSTSIASYLFPCAVAPLEFMVDAIVDDRIVHRMQGNSPYDLRAPAERVSGCVCGCICGCVRREVRHKERIEDERLYIAVHRISFFKTSEHTN